MGIALRHLTVGDLASIRELEAALYEPALRIPGDAFRQLLALFPSGAFGAFDAGRLCGFMFALPVVSGTVLDLDPPPAALPAAADAFYIHDLGVAPTHRGRGLATQLIAAAFGVARSRGLRVCELVAVHGAETFWAHHGFTRLAEFEYVPGVTATRMRTAIADVGP